MASWYFLSDFFKLQFKMRDVKTTVSTSQKITSYISVKLDRFWKFLDDTYGYSQNHIFLQWTTILWKD